MCVYKNFIGGDFNDVVFSCFHICVCVFTGGGSHQYDALR